MCGRYKRSPALVFISLMRAEAVLPGSMLLCRILLGGRILIDWGMAKKGFVDRWFFCTLVLTC